MRKNILMKASALFLVGIMAFTGCGSGNGGGETEEPTTEATEEESLEETSEIGQEDGEDLSDVPEIKAAMVTDVGGVSDMSFNQSAWEGLQRASDTFGAVTRYLESKQDADYLPHLETLVDDGYDLIWGVGFKMEDAIREQATNYPDQMFAIIDHSFAPDEIDNVICVMFNNNEASYLVGLIAGKMTETGKVGMVTGMDVDLMNQFKVGYYAGVKAANPDAEIINQYTESFADATKGKAIAQQMYVDGCDIVHAAAGDSGNGVIEAAKEQNKWAIGVDRDQNDQAPDNVLTSAMKRVDNAIYDVTKEMAKGTITGGQTITYGTANGGVDIAPTSSIHVPQDVLDYVEEMKEQIISGEVVVPATMEELIEMYPEAADY